jgi:hypothetical protein
MIDVQQIFEQALVGAMPITEKLGNLNQLPAGIKKTIESLLKNSMVQQTTNISANSSVETLGKFESMPEFNKALKKYSALGHRVGVIVFTREGKGSTVVAIVDSRYYESGSVTTTTKVRYSSSNSGTFIWGNNTTLGNVLEAEFGSKDGDFEATVVLRDPEYAAKVAARYQNKIGGTPDKYATPESSSKTNFMLGARRQADIIRQQNAARNAAAIIPRNPSLGDVVRALTTANKHIYEYDPVIVINGVNYTLLGVDHSSIFDHNNGIITLAKVLHPNASSRKDYVVIQYNMFSNTVILP